MSRVPTGDLGRIGLEPSARPVNQAFNPEVRADAGGDELLGLADALYQINPAVKGILDRRLQAHQQASIMRASADASRLKLDNMAKLKEAVNRGDIRETDNPWYMVQLRQDVAKVEGARAAQSARDAYYNDPQSPQSQNDPKLVEAFVDNHFASVMEGRDVWEAEVLLPQLQQAKQALVGEHIEKRRREREVERSSAFQATVATALNSVDENTFRDAEAGDQAALTAVNTAVANLQAGLNEAGKTNHWSKVNGWLADAVKDTALVRRDSRLARMVLERITTNGNAKLGDTPEMRAMLANLSLQITSLEMQDTERDERKRQINARRTSQALMSQGLTKLSELRKTNPAATLGDVGLSFNEVAAMELDEESKLELMQRIMQTAGQDQTLRGMQEQALVRTTAAELFLGRRDGKLTPEQDKTLVEVLARNNGMNSLEEIGRILHFSKDEGVVTTAETTANLWATKLDNKLTQRHVLTLLRDGKMNHKDVPFWMNLANREDGGLELLGNATLKRSIESLDEMLTAGFMDRTGAMKRDDLNSDETFLRSRQDAVNKLLTVSEEWLSANPQATRQERQDTLKKHLDEIAVEYGGLSAEKLRASTFAGQKNQTDARAVLQPPPPPGQKPEPPKGMEEVATFTRIDRSLGTITDDQLRAAKAVLDSPVTMPKDYKPQNYDPMAKLSSDEWFKYREGGDPLRDLVKWRLIVAEEKPSDGYGWPLTYKGTGNFTRSGTKVLNVKKDAQEQEIVMHRAAIAKAKRYNAMMESTDFANKFTTLLTTIETQKYATPQQKLDTVRMLEQAQTLAYLRRYVGYDVDEVKAMGKDAWKTTPMFANELDLERRLPSAMKALGLPANDNSYNEFRNAQLRLIHRMHNVTTE